MIVIKAKTFKEFKDEAERLFDEFNDKFEQIEYECSHECIINSSDLDELKDDLKEEFKEQLEKVKDELMKKINDIEKKQLQLAEQISHYHGKFGS